MWRVFFTQTFSQPCQSFFVFSKLQNEEKKRGSRQQTTWQRSVETEALHSCIIVRPQFRSGCTPCEMTDHLIWQICCCPARCCMANWVVVAQLSTAKGMDEWKLGELLVMHLWCFVSCLYLLLVFHIHIYHYSINKVLINVFIYCFFVFISLFCIQNTWEVKIHGEDFDWRYLYVCCSFYCF